MLHGKHLTDLLLSNVFAFLYCILLCALTKPLVSGRAGSFHRSLPQSLCHAICCWWIWRASFWKGSTHAMALRISPRKSVLSWVAIAPWAMRSERAPPICSLLWTQSRQQRPWEPSRPSRRVIGRQRKQRSKQRSSQTSPPRATQASSKSTGPLPNTWTLRKHRRLKLWKIAGGVTSHSSWGQALRPVTLWHLPMFGV